VTRFGSFDNSTCKKVLDLLELGDLRLGQVVIKRVAIVKLGVNNGSGDHSINQSINQFIRQQRAKGHLQVAKYNIQ